MAPRKKDAGIPHSMARDVNVLSVSEESQHKRRSFPWWQGSEIQLIRRKHSSCCSAGKSSFCSAVTQQDSNVRKDTAIPDSVLPFDSNSKLIIQDQIQDLDQSKISSRF
nr:hypothetical protein CFP56_37716 [Quercus suber]